MSGPVPERRVKAAPKAVLAHHLRVGFVEISDRRQHDLRRERQRGDRRPRGDGAVVRPGRDAPRLVVVEAALDTHDPASGGAGAVARRKPPAIFAVALELSRVADRVLLLGERGAAAVLEVVNAALAHVVVADAAKVYPDVRELVNEERPGVQELLAVELLPAVRPCPCLVAALWQGVRRRSQAEHGQENRLAVALPPGFQKPVLRLPCVRDRQAAVLRPLPVDAAVERVGKLRYLALLFRLAVKVGGGGQCPGEQEGCVDGRQFRLPRAPTGLHVQEVIEESLVAGRVPVVALRACLLYT